MALIRIPPAQWRFQGNNIKQLADGLQKVLTTLDQGKDKWQDSSNTVFMEKYEQLCLSIQKSYQALNEVGEQMNGLADIVEQADNDFVSKITC